MNEAEQKTAILDEAFAALTEHFSKMGRPDAEWARREIIDWVLANYPPQ